MSATGSCMPRCAAIPRSCRWGDRHSPLEGKRLPERPDIVVIDVSFISLKTVLPVALSLAAAPMHLLALIKPQFEAAAKASRRASCAMPRCIRRSATTSRRSRHRSAARHRVFPRRSPAATETSNSCWARAVADTSARIDHVGHRGDGVAMPAAALFVPYTLARRNGRGRRTAGTSRPRRSARGRTPRARSASRRSVRISASAAAAPSSNGRRALSCLEARPRRRRAGASRDRCEVAPLIDAHGAGRRRITLHARHGHAWRCSRSALRRRLARHRADRALPDPRAGSWTARIEAAWAHRRGAEPIGQAARYPGHRHRQRARCRCARLRATATRADARLVAHRRAASAGAADAPRRTGR